MKAFFLTDWFNQIRKLFRRSTRVHTAIRLLIIFACVLRYFSDPPNVETYWLLTVAGFAIYTLIIGKFSEYVHFSARRAYYWIPLVGDTIFVSLFYLQTHKLLSDMYLFFYLPILVASDTVQQKDQIPVFLLISSIFLGSIILLFATSSDTAVSMSVFLRTLLPRAVIFLLVLFISLMRGNTLKEQAEIMDAAHVTALRVGEGEDLKTRLEKIMDSAISLLDGNGCMVFLKLPRRNILELAATRGIDSSVMKAGYQIRLHQDLAGVVFSNGIPKIENNYSEYDRRLSELERVVKAVIAVPLMIANQPIGVISVFNNRPRRNFGDQHLELLLRLAPYVANAIHDSQVLKDAKLQADALSVINHAGQELNTNLEIESVYRQAAKHAWLLSNLYAEIASTFSCIGILDRDTGVLDIVSTYPEKYYLQIKQELGTIDTKKDRIGIVGRSVIESRSVLSNYVEDDLDYIKFHATTQSQLAVPIIEKGGTAIGVISVEHSEVGALPETLQSNLEILSNQVSAAIRNAKLFEEQQRQHSQTIALYDATSAIDLTRGVKTAAENILFELHTWLPYTRATLQVIKNGERQIIATNNLQPEKIDKYLVRPIEQDELISSIIKSRKVRYLKDPISEPKWKKLPTTADIQTWICVPLYVGKECIGLITLDFVKKYHPPEEIEVLLPIFANEAASILNNAILYTENVERVEQLTNVQEKLNLVLDFLTENQNLINIGLVYGEDIHYANNKLGHAKSSASDIARNRLGPASDQVRNAAKEIQKNIDAYLKALKETQNKVVEPPILVSVNVHDLLERAVQKKWKSWWAADVDPIMRLDAKNPLIRAPEKQLEQVFLVILQNGIDALPRGKGSLIISTEDYWIRNKQFIRVHFTDSGSGIPPDIAKGLFTYKVHYTKPGHSGLGLLWARSIMRTYQGDISYITEMGKGTTFAVLVPRDFDRPMFFSKIP